MYVTVIKEEKLSVIVQQLKFYFQHYFYCSNNTNKSKLLVGGEGGQLIKQLKAQKKSSLGLKSSLGTNIDSNFVKKKN